jgi:molybdopterin molybdotransferase
MPDMQPNDDSFSVDDGPLPLACAIDRLRRTLVCVTGVESVPLGRALGRILAADQVSTLAVPAFDAAAMDGWAVRAADLGRIPLPVGGRIAAGHPVAVPIRPGHAYRIFTGAPVPAGLDTVVAQEMAREADGVVHLPPMRAGVNLRRAGEAVTVGDRPLVAGTVLGPPHLGVAAMLGLGELPVRIRLRVAVASTGDEVCEPGSPLPPGGLYDANRIGLIAMLGAMGCAVTDLGILADQPDSLAAALARAAADHDLIVSSGGASVGEEDHLLAVIRRLGRLDFWRLAVKPGKPLLVGRIGATPLIGLPGNPVAVMVGFLLVGREVVAALAGATRPDPRRYFLPAAFSLNKPAWRREFPRAHLDEAGAVHLFPSDSSGALTSISGSDGLVDIPEDIVEIRPGDSVAFLPFNELMG